VVALLLAVSALARGHIAEAVRWRPDFAVRLTYFDQQAIVPNTLILGKVMLGAAVVSLLFVPAAYAAGMPTRRHL
jgi:hypothetical protein